MSKHLSELCILVVDELYGHLPSRLFSLFTTHGRLHLPALTQRSGLPPRYVKCGLAILVQHHLVLYYISDEDNAAYYEANMRNAYDLIRIGRDVQNVRQSLGVDAGRIAKVLLFQGSNSPTEISEELRGRDTPDVNGMCNGNGHVNGEKEHETDDGSRDTICAASDHCEVPEQLFSYRFAVRARRMDFMPTFDFDTMVEHQVLHSDPFRGIVKGKDSKKDYANRVQSQRRNMPLNNKVDVSKAFGASMVAPQRKRNLNAVEGMSRNPHEKSSDHDRPSKHRKLNLGRGYAGYEDSPETTAGVGPDSKANSKDEPQAQAHRKKISEDRIGELAIRMNHDKLDTMRRSESLVALAARSLGETPAKVYAALLRCVVKRVHRCFDVNPVDPDEIDSDAEDEPLDPSKILHESAEVSPEIHISEIALELDADADLSSASESNDQKTAKVNIEIDQPTNNKRKINGVRHTHQIMDNEKPDDLKDKRSSLAAHIRQALGVLSDAPHQFVHPATSDTQTGWRINFPVLSAKLIQLELERLINARFGSVAVRIVRYLHARGRVEEKNIASALLLQQKDVRARLGGMQEYSVVDTQEIPRDTSRQPNRTIFLWFFDQERCRKLVLEDLYKAMCRLLQRMRVEREMVQGVVEKAERTDVRGHEDEYLTETEKRVLHDWEGREERILVQLGRLDDTVAVLRDFLPPGMM